MRTESLRRKNLRQKLNYDRYPVGILLDGLHDAGNIGSMLRLTNAFLIDGTYYNGELEKIRIHKAAVGTQYFEKLERVSDLDKFLSLYDKIVVFENKVWNSQPIEEYHFAPNQKYLFVFGNESDGVSQELMKRANKILTISQRGPVGSLNVATAAAIALYEYNKQNCGKGDVYV